MKSTFFVMGATFISLATAVGCSSSSTSTGGTGGSDAGNEQTDGGGAEGTDSGAEPTDGGGATPTWTTVYTTIISPSCGTKCHASDSKSGGLDMGSQATAYANLVGVAATGGCAGQGDFIKAGDPASSVLYSKVSATSPVCGSQMPLGGPYLSADKVAIISAWIAAGAENN